MAVVGHSVRPPAPPPNLGGMMEISQERKRKFWERCGFKFNEYTSRFEHWWEWTSPNGKVRGFGCPPIDPNFLFEYAMPTLLERGLNVHIHILKGRPVKVVLSSVSTTHQAVNDDLGMALFLAIEKVWEE